MRDLSSLFETEHKSKYPFWFVEHVLWTLFVEGRPAPPKPDAGEREGEGTVRTAREGSACLVNGFRRSCGISLTSLSTRKPGGAEQEDLKPEKAFETKLAYAFTLLGYETEELGQGTGREPDGVALSVSMGQGDYAIVYDAKAREGKFSIGTSDREIFEYIQKKRDQLRREKRIHKLYFVVVSSDFDDRSAQETLRDIYKRTQVPITLLKASDLLFIIDTKLQDVRIDHSKLEDLFLDTGIISREKISDILGVR